MKEAMDTTVKTAREIPSLVKTPVLGEIVRMESPQDRLYKWAAQGAVLLAVLAVLTVGIYFFHEYVMPLEVFWAKVQRHLLRVHSV